MKLCFCDLETTGLNAWKHGVIEIAMNIWEDDVEKGMIHLYVQPKDTDEITEKALEVNGRTKEEIFSEPFIPPSQVLERLKKMLKEYIDPYKKEDKMFFIAFNAHFDDGFLRSFFKKQGDVYFGSWFHWPPIEVATLASLHLRKTRHEMKNFRLSTVAEAMGVERAEGDAHEGLSDMLVMRDIYRKCVEGK